MLSMNTVLDYIKDNLGWPHIQLELTDQEITEYIKRNTLKEFSYFVPQVWKCTLNTDLPAAKVAGRGNEFYIWEPDGMEILSVKDIYTNTGELFLHGHPPLGAMSMGEVQEFALSVYNAMTVKMFSSFDMTFEFQHPNILRISPMKSTNYGIVTVEYERGQPDDLSGIPNDLQSYFKKLALADIMIILGRIRKKYGGGNLHTPFGDIPLDAEIGDEGKELRREVIEILEKGAIPNIRIAFG